MPDTFESDHEKLNNAIEILARDSTRNSIKFKLTLELFENLCFHAHLLLMIRDSSHTTKDWKTCTNKVCVINQDSLERINKL